MNPKRQFFPGQRNDVPMDREPGKARHEAGVARKTEAGRPRLVDGAIIVAVVSGFFYFWGRLYLDGYYYVIGFSEAELHFDIPYVMMTSIFPLLWPVALLFLVALACMILPSPKPPSITRQPFYPIRTSEAVAVVLSVWAAKILLDAIQPAASTYWLAWHRRDVILAALGFAILAGLYWAARRRESQRGRRILSPGTIMVSITNVLAILLVSWFWVEGRGWLLSRFKTVLLGLAVAYSVFEISKEIRQYKSRTVRSSEAPISSAHDADKRRKAGWTGFLIVVSAMSLMFAAGLTGTVAAQKMLRGCETFRTVNFDPIPSVLQKNHTYWLILHEGGLYFLRDMTSGPDNGTWVISETAGMSAEIDRVMAPKKC
jgi:hypothetical protein